LLITDLESTYTKCGWKAHFYTKSAVSNQDGFTQFYSDDAVDHLEWGGSIVGKFNYYYLKI
jgi:hypothetical protein